MRETLPLLRRTLELVQKPVMALGGLLIFVMMLHVVADVLSKYLLNQPIVGTLEVVSNYYMVAAVFLPLAAVQSQNGHVKVEVFTVGMPKRLVGAIDAFAAVLMLIYVGLMTWFVLVEAIEETAIREKLQIGLKFLPVWPARWFAPVGALLFMIAIVLSISTFVRTARGIEPEEEKTKDDEWTA